jgi:hypothetical protein
MFDGPEVKSSIRAMVYSPSPSQSFEFADYLCHPVSGSAFKVCRSLPIHC